MIKVFGIDIGTTFITVYEEQNQSVFRIRHKGKITEPLYKILMDRNDNDTIVFTGKGGKEIAESMDSVYIDEAVAISYGLSGNDPFKGGKGKIIDIGASSLTLYTVNESKVTDLIQNTLCAAGTGLFLEEQAERLDISLESRGRLQVETVPLIASRCTVFAKSDLIHHQQEGRTKDEMWAGLCRSLVISAINTLFRGEELKGKIMICGGVSLNEEVLRWFKVLYPHVQWIVPKNSEAVVAAGAANAPGKAINELDLAVTLKKKEFEKMPPLILKRSQYPKMTTPAIDINNNEIRIHKKMENVHQVILGMDIGSTSTKLAVLDAKNFSPLFDIYGRTAGDPINASRKIFSSYYAILGDRDVPVSAFGTTGSGRLIVGKIFGADNIINELSAHAKGTSHFFPDVETIFEIGGQDAKYIRLQDGYIADVNMNYVCAAGTGSFVEEQARKLGFKVDEIGSITKGITPPVTSDRCTVFMEQDLMALLKAGFSKEEALASVLYSVIRNYLNRVKGNRPSNETRIFFQGATPRNKGLVAAMENLLNVEVVVSPFCHLMGAIGAALMTQEYMKEQDNSKNSSGFIGRDAAHLEVSSRTEICKLCRNFCRINYISRDGGSEFSWGYQCGRDPEKKSRREVPQYHLFLKRRQAFSLKNDVKNNDPSEKRSITIVNALSNFTYYPLWKRFFEQLGYRTRISGNTDTSIKNHSSAIASADFCYPVKIVLGHAVKALEKNEPIFLPYMIADKPALQTAHSFFCPYVESSASIVRSTLRRNKIPSSEMISPIIDLRRPVKETAESLYNGLHGRLKIKKKDVLTAFKNAQQYWESFTKSQEQAGMDQLEQIKKSGEIAFVLLGRSYNLHDRGLNLGIPEKIASMGYPVIPMDMLSLDVKSLAEGNYHNLFWKYGQRIIAAMKIINECKRIFPIYLTNFNCGPDSFLLGYAEEEIKGKPMLILEMDEHDSDGGYLTRIEAFLDVVHAYLKRQQAPKVNKMPHIFTARRQPDTRGMVWIPPMHAAGSRLIASSFRTFGYDAQPLELEDQETFALGKKYLRGGECLPMTLTLGSFLKAMQKNNKTQRNILFMPTTEGPCRFGQYNLMDRIVFNNLELKNVDILSPSSINSYQGLEGDLRRNLIHAMMCSDLLLKMTTKIRPYERTKGDTDECFEEAIKQLESEWGRNYVPKKTIKKYASKFASINIHKDQKPLVGIVGEIYVRCNAFSNGNLIEVIEKNEGEAWLSPMHEWVVYIAYMQKAFKWNRYFNSVKKGEALMTNIYLHRAEQSYYQAASEILHDRHEPAMKDVVEAGAEYLPVDFVGEAILTIGRAIHFAQQGASMVVNAAPFGCMPGTLSSALLLEIKEKFNIPFVSLFYDGDIDVNDKVASLLKTISIEKIKETIQQAMDKRNQFLVDMT